MWVNSMNLDHAIQIDVIFTGVNDVWHLQIEMRTGDELCIKAGTESECRLELRRIMVALAAGVEVYEVGKGVFDVRNEYGENASITQKRPAPIILLETEVQNG